VEHPPIITLTTDFGTQDGYVGAMLGVILGICPRAQLHTITHAIDPQDVRGGAQALATAAPWFPRGTVHVGVVDPGVGTARRGVVVEVGGQRFVGPDNGLFGPVVDALEAHSDRARWLQIDAPGRTLPHISSTFHGRDVFAPIAAHLAAGVPLSALGVELPDPVRLPPPLCRRDGDAVWGEVVTVDRFGNLITNIPASAVEGAPDVRAHWVDHPDASAVEGLLRSYGEAVDGGLLLLVGSSGYVEVAVNGGSAAAALGLRRGARLQLVAQRPAQGSM